MCLKKHLRKHCYEGKIYVDCYCDQLDLYTLVTAIYNLHTRE